MKNLLSVMVFLAGILAPHRVQAQGTVYFSNVNLPRVNGLGVLSNQWLAAQFVTGSAVNGYVLNSIDYLSAGKLGSPSGFALALFSDSSGLPSLNLGTLSGSSIPTSDGGLYDYTTEGIALSPSTPYWVMASGPDSVNIGAFFWAVAGSTDHVSSDGWTGNAISAISSDGGASWIGGSGINFQYAIHASAVPEPQPIALAGLGLAVLILRRKN